MAETTPANAGPYLSSAYFGEQVVSMLRESLFDALADPGANMTYVRDTLLLSGANKLDDDAYLQARDMATGSAQAGRVQWAALSSRGATNP